MSFIESDTYRVYDIVKPSKTSRNLVAPGGLYSGEPQLDAHQARYASWEEAARVAMVFDAIDGIATPEELRSFDLDID